MFPFQRAAREHHAYSVVIQGGSSCVSEADKPVPAVSFCERKTVAHPLDGVLSMILASKCTQFQCSGACSQRNQYIVAFDVDISKV